MNKNLLVILMFPVLIMASVTREKGNQIAAWTTYGIKNYSSSVLNIIYRGIAIKDNKASSRAVGMYSPQKYTSSALELMYKKEFKNIDH